MSNPGDVFPSRNLGPAEKWGRTVEERLEDLESTLPGGSNSAQVSALTKFVADGWTAQTEVNPGDFEGTITWATYPPSSDVDSDDPDDPEIMPEPDLEEEAPEVPPVLELREVSTYEVPEAFFVLGIQTYLGTHYILSYDPSAGYLLRTYDPDADEWGEAWDLPDPYPVTLKIYEGIVYVLFSDGGVASFNLAGEQLAFLPPTGNSGSQALHVDETGVWYGATDGTNTFVPCLTHVDLEPTGEVFDPTGSSVILALTRFNGTLYALYHRALGSTNAIILQGYGGSSRSLRTGYTSAVMDADDTALYVAFSGTHLEAFDPDFNTLASTTLSPATSVVTVVDSNELYAPGGGSVRRYRLAYEDAPSDPDPMPAPDPIPTEVVVDPQPVYSTWKQVDENGQIQGEWQWIDGFWEPRPAGGGVIAVDAISADHIQHDAVTVDKIADDAITETKIADGSIKTPKLAANAVTAGKIAAGAVEAEKIAAEAITANKIAAGAVEAEKIAANAITSEKIEAEAITTNKIAAQAIIGEKIAANTIGAGKIDTETLGADQGFINVLNSSTINLTGQITAGSDDYEVSMSPLGLVLASRASLTSPTTYTYPTSDLWGFTRGLAPVPGGLFAVMLDESDGQGAIATSWIEVRAASNNALMRTINPPAGYRFARLYAQPNSNNIFCMVVDSTTYAWGVVRFNTLTGAQVGSVIPLTSPPQSVYMTSFAVSDNFFYTGRFHTPDPIDWTQSYATFQKWDFSGNLVEDWEAPDLIAGLSFEFSPLSELAMAATDDTIYLSAFPSKKIHQYTDSGAHVREFYRGSFVFALGLWNDSLVIADKDRLVTGTPLSADAPSWSWYLPYEETWGLELAITDNDLLLVSNRTPESPPPTRVDMFSVVGLTDVRARLDTQLGRLTAVGADFSGTTSMDRLDVARVMPPPGGDLLISEHTTFGFNIFSTESELVSDFDMGGARPGAIAATTSPDPTAWIKTSSGWKPIAPEGEQITAPYQSLDDYTTPGVYYWTTGSPGASWEGLNYPENARGTLEVIGARKGTTVLTQVYTTTGTTSTPGNRYWRTRNTAVSGWSPWVKVATAPSEWTTLPVVSGWTMDANDPLRYQINNGWVYFQGLLRRSSGDIPTTYTEAFVVPSAIMPSLGPGTGNRKTAIRMVTGGAGGTPVGWDIQTSGGSARAISQVSTSSWVSVDSLSWPIGD